MFINLILTFKWLIWWLFCLFGCGQLFHFSWNENYYESYIIQCIMCVSTTCVMYNSVNLWHVQVRWLAIWTNDFGHKKYMTLNCEVIRQTVDNSSVQHPVIIKQKISCLTSSTPDKHVTVGILEIFFVLFEKLQKATIIDFIQNLNL